MNFHTAQFEQEVEKKSEVENAIRTILGFVGETEREG